MIALDTNILLRYLAQDGGAQAAAATALIEDELNEEQPAFLSLITLVEMIWVMRRHYGLDSQGIGAVVRGLLAAPQFVVQESAIVTHALAQAGHDMADVLIHEIGKANGCDKTLTFDRKFARLAGVELLTR